MDERWGVGFKVGRVYVLKLDVIKKERTNRVVEKRIHLV
jgi:hypothetical protein